MKGNRIFSVVIVLALLFACSARVTRVSGSPPFDTGTEYASGYFSSEWGGVWYAWINALGTQMIFTALYSDVVQFAGPRLPGRALQLALGQPDSCWKRANHDRSLQRHQPKRHLDANYTDRTSELEYYILVNSSKTFNLSPVQKTDVNGSAHYQWGVTYGGHRCFLGFS